MAAPDLYEEPAYDDVGPDEQKRDGEESVEAPSVTNTAVLREDEEAGPEDRERD